MAATSAPSPADKARTLREIADAVEHGAELSPAIIELADRLAETARAARIRAMGQDFAARHKSILEALAK